MYFKKNDSIKLCSIKLTYIYNCKLYTHTHIYTPTKQLILLASEEKTWWLQSGVGIRTFQ